MTDSLQQPRSVESLPVQLQGRLGEVSIARRAMDQALGRMLEKQEITERAARIFSGALTPQFVTTEHEAVVTTHPMSDQAIEAQVQDFARAMNDGGLEEVTQAWASPNADYVERLAADTLPIDNTRTQAEIEALQRVFEVYNQAENGAVEQ